MEIGGGEPHKRVDMKNTRNGDTEELQNAHFSGASMLLRLECK